MIGIYKIVSPSGKTYIGQSVDIERRKIQYKNKHCKDQPRIFNSIKKYGWEKHIHEIIEECLIEQLDKKETFYKQQFINEFGWTKALFCGLHDTGGGHKTEEHKRKISESHKGMKKEWVSKNLKGQKHTPERIAHRTKILKNKYNPIYQYDLEGNFIKEWKTAKKASKMLNLSNGTLSIVIDNINRTLGGFRFTRQKYKFLPITTKWKNVKKIIEQYDLEGNFLHEFSSAKEAAEYLNVFIQNITACCRGEKNSAYKFIWKYKNI
jgi:group I intron endonuclease